MTPPRAPVQTTGFATHVAMIELEGRRAHRQVFTQAPLGDLRKTLERARDHALVALDVLAKIEAEQAEKAESA